VKPGLRAHTYHVYEIAVRRHLVPAFGTAPLAKLTPQHVQKMQARMADQGLSTSSIGVARAALGGALTQAERWGLIARNVVRLVDAPAADGPEPKVFTPEQAAAFCASAKGHPLEHLFTTMLATGLRIGEGLGLQWRHVDLEARVPVLHVRQQSIELSGQPRSLEEPKSRTGRRCVPLISMAVEALRAQHDRLVFQRRAAAGLWRENDLVFPNELGELLSYHRAAAEFDRLCTAAGIQDSQYVELQSERDLLRRKRRAGDKTAIKADADARTTRLRALERQLRQLGYTPHCLRHSTGTFLTAAGVPDRVVMEILGHSSLNMTRHYQHVVSTMLEDAGRRLDAFFPSVRAVN
jgi:integrase